MESRKSNLPTARDRCRDLRISIEVKGLGFLGVSGSVRPPHLSRRAGFPNCDFWNSDGVHRVGRGTPKRERPKGSRRFRSNLRVGPMAVVFLFASAWLVSNASQLKGNYCAPEIREGQDADNPSVTRKLSAGPGGCLVITRAS